MTEAERKLSRELKVDHGVTRLGRLSGVFSNFRGMLREEKYAEADSAAAHHTLWGGTGGEMKAPTCDEDEMQNILTGGDLKIEINHNYPEKKPPAPAPEVSAARAASTTSPPSETSKSNTLGTVLSTAAKAAGFGTPIGIALLALPAISSLFNGEEKQNEPSPPPAQTSSTTIINRGGVPPEFSLEPDKEVEK